MINHNLEISPELHQTAENDFPSNTRFDRPLGPEELSMLRNQWELFCQLQSLHIEENPIHARMQRGEPELSQGTLFHGSEFSLETVQSMMKSGILSGELLGIPEESETHYCADFFKVPEDMEMKQYLDWCAQKTGFKRKGEWNRLPMPGKAARSMALIVDVTDPRLAPLLVHDAYRPEAQSEMSAVINRLPSGRSSVDTAAILLGIPHNFISGILLSDAISNEEVSAVQKIMGKNVLIFRTNGEVLK